MADSVRKRGLQALEAELLQLKHAGIVKVVSREFLEIEQIEPHEFPALFLVALPGGGQEPAVRNHLLEDLLVGIWGYAVAPVDQLAEDVREDLLKIVKDQLYAPTMVARIQADQTLSAAQGLGSMLIDVKHLGPPDAVDEGTDPERRVWFRLPVSVRVQELRGKA